MVGVLLYTLPNFSQITFKNFVHFCKSIGKWFSLFWILRFKQHSKLVFLIWPSLLCFNHRTKWLKVLSYRLSDAQFNYQSVDCFWTVLNSGFFESERLCNEKTTLEVLEKGVIFNQQFKRTKRRPGVAKRTIEKIFEETATFSFTEDKSREGKSNRVAGMHCNHRNK